MGVVSEGLHCLFQLLSDSIPGGPLMYSMSDVPQHENTRSVTHGNLSSKAYHSCMPGRMEDTSKTYSKPAHCIQAGTADLVQVEMSHAELRAPGSTVKKVLLVAQNGAKGVSNKANGQRLHIDGTKFPNAWGDVYPIDSRGAGNSFGTCYCDHEASIQ